MQHIKFKQKQKTNPYHLYVLLAPHLNNEGAKNTGWVGEYKGIPMLFTENSGFTLALACSSKWLKRSVGFVGTSDAWTDIHQHKKMKWEYTNAETGNIALTGEIDISERKDCVLALSFGRTQTEAANHARASLLEGFASAKQNYMDEWELIKTNRSF